MPVSTPVELSKVNHDGSDIEDNVGGAGDCTSKVYVYLFFVNANKGGEDVTIIFSVTVIVNDCVVNAPSESVALICTLWSPR